MKSGCFRLFLVHVHKSSWVPVALHCSLGTTALCSVTCNLLEAISPIGALSILNSKMFICKKISKMFIC